MPKFTMVIGLPLSGKTTWCKNNCTKNTHIVCWDTIEKTATDPSRVFDTVVKCIKQHLENGKDVILDGTFLNRRRRRTLLNMLPKNVVKEAVFLVVPYEECVTRNESRPIDTQISKETMLHSYHKLHIPWYEEGFTHINIITNKDYNGYIQLLNTEYLNMNESQNNEHHSYTIGQHCKEAEKYAHTIALREHLNYNTTYNILTKACRFHDVGKSFCKTFTTFKGEVTDTAHFYGHESVSAYLYVLGAMSLPYLDDQYVRNVLTTANLINNHMIFFDTSAIKRLKTYYSEDFWKLLEFVHEADVNAH